MAARGAHLLPVGVRAALQHVLDHVVAVLVLAQRARGAQDLVHHHRLQGQGERGAWCANAMSHPGHGTLPLLTMPILRYRSIHPTRLPHHYSAPTPGPACSDPQLLGRTLRSASEQCSRMRWMTRQPKGWLLSGTTHVRKLSSSACRRCSWLMVWGLVGGSLGNGAMWFGEDEGHRGRQMVAAYSQQHHSP